MTDDLPKVPDGGPVMGSIQFSMMPGEVIHKLNDPSTAAQKLEALWQAAVRECNDSQTRGFRILRLEDMLSDLQWLFLDGDQRLVCPVCRALQDDGHRDDCALNDLLTGRVAPWERP